MHSRHLLLAVLAVAPLPGCDGWKTADHHAGLLFVPNVDPVDVDGRHLIRLRGRDAAVFIDPAGGAIVDFHLQRRAVYDYEPDPQREQQLTRIERSFPAGPNALAAEGWCAVSVPEHAALDSGMHWQVDAHSIGLVLLSDTVDGLRWRKSYELSDNGVLDIRVALENRSNSPRQLGAESRLRAPGPIVSGEGVEHAWAANQWLTRTLLEGEGFRLPLREVPGGGSITWKERWWITPSRDSAAAPATRREPLRRPWDAYIGNTPDGFRSYPD